MAWYETFFSGMALDLWRALVTPEQTEAEVDGVLRWLGPPPDAALLDVPCGNGRHARRLAARGYRVTGVDLVGDIRVEIVNLYEPAEGRLDTTYVFERRGRRETRRASHGVFTAAEIRRLLAEAGLETVGLYADLHGAPFAVGAPRLFVVAER